MGREIGRITEVRGVSVKAELFELLPPYILECGRLRIAPRINTFVKTKVGLDVIICQITGEYYDGNTKGLFTGYYLELEVKGYFRGNRFIQGLRLLPIVSASIELLDETDLESINEYDSGTSFLLGKDLYDNSQNVHLSYNRIIPSHVGVFGNTGSGKSNTLTRLLHEYSKVLKNEKNGKLLIIDLNNEYGADAICGHDDKKIYHLSTRTTNADKIPFNLGNMSEDEWCILLNATEATQRPVVKTAYNDDKSENDYCEIVKQLVKLGNHQLVKSIQYHLCDYIDVVGELVWNSTVEKYYFKDTVGKLYSDMDGFDDRLDQMTVRVPNDDLEHMLFKLYFATARHIGYGTQYDYISPLLRRAEKLVNDLKKVFVFSKEDIFDDHNIVVIQLADVNNDMTEIVPSVVANGLFKAKIGSKGEESVKDIINIVIDEAHNLLYENERDYRHTKVTIDVFEKVIKEGRKYGFFLWVASQRPSDISQTIISQMHNYFIHKLVNPYDISRIRKSVAFLDDNAMDALTVLGSGECIISGTGVSMPYFVTVNQVDEQFRPNSEDVILFGDDGIFS